VTYTVEFEPSGIRLVCEEPLTISDAPPVNVHTALQAVHKLGHYPIAKDLAAITVEPHKFTPFDDWLKGQPEADVIFKAREKK